MKVGMRQQRLDVDANGGVAGWRGMGRAVSTVSGGEASERTWDKRGSQCIAKVSRNLFQMLAPFLLSTAQPATPPLVRASCKL